MSIDLLILGNAPIERMLERVKLAEDNGYDTAWLADERFYREVYSCLTYFAQRTSRVKVGPCVTDPYARHPALTAMAIATLDEISNRRAILGIGAGISGIRRTWHRPQETRAGDPRSHRTDPHAAARRKGHLQG